MRRDQRRVFYYDLVIKKLGKSSQLPKLSEICTVWQEHCSAGTARLPRSNGERLFQIKEIIIDYENSTATILVSLTDLNRSDAVYGNIDTGEARVLEKAEREGGNYSSHIVMSLTTSKANTYPCLIEGVPNLSSTDIAYLLNRILRDNYKTNRERFTYPDPGGARHRGGAIKRHSYLPLVEFKGFPSAELLADLEAGRIRHISLTRSYENKPFGDDPFLVEQEHSLRIVPKVNLPSAGRFNRLVSAIKSRSTDFSTARISFINPDGQTKSVDYDLASDTIKDMHYVKSKLIEGINPPLAEASARIVFRLADRMKSIVIAERGEPTT